jgi:hypothetical protein
MIEVMQEAISGIETVKAFLVNHIINNIFIKKNKLIVDTSLKRSIHANFAQSLWQIVLIPYQAVFLEWEDIGILRMGPLR